MYSRGKMALSLAAERLDLDTMRRKDPNHDDGDDDDKVLRNDGIRHRQQQVMMEHFEVMRQ
jgi:hypothetical protein